MSRLAEAITAARADWGPLPEELLRALDWMQEQGWTGGSDGGVWATPYPGERRLGVVFRSDLALDAWFGGAAAAQLLPVAQSDGAGGVLALWRAPDGSTPVVLVNDMDQLVVARSTLDLLRLLAIGHDELRSWTVADEPPVESAGAHQAFREWVSTTFDVAVPPVWDQLGADEFTDWSDEQRGGSGEPVSVTENPDREAGRTQVEGAVTVLLGLLGRPDGPEAVGAVAELVGAPLGQTLASSTRQLGKVGVEVDVNRRTVEVIWLQLGTPRSIGYGIAPRKGPLWTGPPLIEGLTARSTRTEARAMLGEPEREGQDHLRYRVHDAFLHLSFGEEDLLAGITLMLRVP